jgi:hypothetical protein
MIKKAILIVLASLICMSVSVATVDMNLNLYSGSSTYSASAVISGNAWGSATSVSTPLGFSHVSEWEGYNCGNNQDFSIELDQSLSFLKKASQPDDPYFHDWVNVYGTGSGRDTATVNTQAGLSLLGSGWTTGGIGTSGIAKTDYVEYGLYATDFEDWSASFGIEAYNFQPKEFSWNGGASFDPDTSLYPTAGWAWELS